jgi:tetratricopeptide (TPR) repeat protein
MFLQLTRTGNRLAGAFLLVLVVSATGCPALFDPPQQISKALPISTATPLADQATSGFWDALHGNRTEDLPGVLENLRAAYDENPQDAVVTRLLGIGLTWRVVERGRIDDPDYDPAVALEEARDFLDRALELAPGHRVATAIRTAVTGVSAIMNGDSAGFDQAYAELLANTRADPEFHGFVQGWAISAYVSPDDPRYDAAYAGYFATLDACAGFETPRDVTAPPPILLSILACRAEHTDTACYNNDIAPHNIEALLLALGDAYLKDGRIARARDAYEAIPTLPSYAAWRFQAELAQRLENLESLSEKFRADSGLFTVQEPAMSLQSRIACTSCHAQ